MRNLTELNRYRDRAPDVLAYYGGVGNERMGAFLVPSPTCAQFMRVVASSGMGWDHVSVSLRNRCPNWPEMACVKDLFFKDDETAYQIHPPTSEYVNCHPYCLHLWRSLNLVMPRPLPMLVGPQSERKASR